MHTAQQGHALLRYSGGVDAWDAQVSLGTSALSEDEALNTSADDSMLSDVAATCPQSPSLDACAVSNSNSHAFETAKPETASSTARKQWPSALALTVLPPDVRWLVAVIVEWVAVLAAPLELRPATTTQSGALQGGAGDAGAYFSLSIGATPDVSLSSGELSSKSVSSAEITAAPSTSAPIKTSHPSNDAVALDPARPSLTPHTGASDLASSLLALQASTLPSLQHETPLTQLETIHAFNAHAIAARAAALCPPSQAPVAAYMDWLGAALLLVRNDGPMAAALRARLPALDAVCQWVSGLADQPAQQIGSTEQSQPNSTTQASADGENKEMESVDQDKSSASTRRWQRVSLWTPTPIGALPGSRYPLLSSARPSLPLDNEDFVNGAVHGDLQCSINVLSQDECAETYRRLVEDYRRKNALCNVITAPTVDDVDLIVRTFDSDWISRHDPTSSPAKAQAVPVLKREPMKRMRSKSAAISKATAAVNAYSPQVADRVDTETQQSGSSVDVSTAVSGDEGLADLPSVSVVSDCAVTAEESALVAAAAAEAEVGAALSSVDSAGLDADAVMTDILPVSPTVSIPLNGDQAVEPSA